MASPATSLGFLLLTGNSIVALHRSSGDMAAIIFIVSAYTSLVLLFHCLRRFEMVLQPSAERERAKLSVWLLTTQLTAMFSWWVAELLPPVAPEVSLMAASTVVGGFYALFILPRAD